MTRSRWGAILLLVAVFVAGGLVGAAVWRAAEHRTEAREHRHDRGPQGYLDRLTKRLHLTPAQRDSVRTILVRHQPGIDSLWRSTAARFDSLRTEVRSEIRSQLTPEQQQTYAEMLRQADARRREAVPPAQPHDSH